MSDIVIKVENLGKKYIINHQQQERYTALRDVIIHRTKTLFNPFQKNKEQIQNSTKEEFWALKNVSFEIKQGDRVGIIGRNGAGKSTLLKILSRIVEQSTGKISIKGRVASLLEVGTGFHPELTGRENIFLNGAILGMSKNEIQRKFDEIVAFSEVEKFLDTPVKRYSSGMYVRLAFSVAAYLEPEILIVDEVLAVGDAAFQKKCLGKMESVSKDGRTILFVSHQMAALQNLCQRAILLKRGEVIFNDKTDVVVTKYLAETSNLMQTPLSERKDRHGTGDIRFTSIFLYDEFGNSINSFYSGQTVRIVFEYENFQNFELSNVYFAIGLNDNFGNRIIFFSNELTNYTFPNIPPGLGKMAIDIYKLPIVQGRYTVTIYCTVSGTISDWIQDAGTINVEQGDYYGTGKLPNSSQGICLANYKILLL